MKEQGDSMAQKERKKNNVFKARLWTSQLGGFRRKPLYAYYCSGEELKKDQDLCVDIDLDTQIVISTESIIKVLKKYKRI